MREERIVLAGRELVLARPDDPESLIDEERFDEDEFLPYWAELWPSGIALARHVAGLELGGASVLELGCGLALPSFAAVLAGAESVVATDWASEAVDLVRVNAAANGLGVTAAVLDWTVGARPRRPAASISSSPPTCCTRSETRRRSSACSTPRSLPAARH